MADSTNDAQAAELQALRDYAREISKAITGLTISAGSEWFKPVAGDHYVDPAFAAARLTEMLDQGRTARRELARLRATPNQEQSS